MELFRLKSDNYCLNCIAVRPHYPVVICVFAFCVKVKYIPVGIGSKLLNKIKLGSPIVLSPLMCWLTKPKLHYILQGEPIANNWQPPRKSGLTPKATKTRVVRYAIIQSFQWFSELTYSSSEASNYDVVYTVYRQTVLIYLYKNIYGIS